MLSLSCTQSSTFFVTTIYMTKIITSQKALLPNFSEDSWGQRGLSIITEYLPHLVLDSLVLKAFLLLYPIILLSSLCCFLLYSPLFLALKYSKAKTNEQNTIIFSKPFSSVLPLKLASLTSPFYTAKDLAKILGSLD